MEEQLKVITDCVYEINPSLKQPSIGCHIEIGNEKYIVVNEGIKDDEKYYVLINLSFNKPAVFTTHQSTMQFYKIVGKDITLTDVLFALRPFENYAINSYGEFLSAITKNMSHQDYTQIENIKINTSSPYIKDQPKELIEFLKKQENVQRYYKD